MIQGAASLADRSLTEVRDKGVQPPCSEVS
jgi:hypothetical protein